MSDMQHHSAASSEELINHENDYIEALKGERKAIEDLLAFHEGEELFTDERKKYYQDKQRKLELDQEIAIKEEYVKQLEKRIAQEKEYREAMVQEYNREIITYLDRAMLLYSDDDTTVKELQNAKNRVQSGKIKTDAEKVSLLNQVKQLIANANGKSDN